MEGTIVHDRDGHEQFQLIEKLGAGAYGSVFSARAVDTGDSVAVKVTERQDVARKEAEIIQILCHPNIVKFKSFFVNQDRSYITMELGRECMYGVQTRRGGPFSDTECRSFIRDILNGLSWLKSKLIVHRDIKPKNLLLSNRNRVLIADYGIAERLRSQDEVIKGVAGTRYYIAGEVIRGEQYSFPADQFGAGCCLYEFLIGTSAFDFGEPDLPPAEIDHKLWNGIINPPPSSCSPSGSDLIKLLMHPDQKQRIASEDALKRSFLADFFIPETLPNIISTQPPSYYFFTRETLILCQECMDWILAKLRKVVTKASLVMHRIRGIDVIVKMSTIAFAYNILYTGKGLGYHLTNGSVGFLFREDHTSIIETSVRDAEAWHCIYVDKEQNGRGINNVTAVGSDLEKLYFFQFSQECMEGPSKILPQCVEKDQFARVWKFYENQKVIVFALSNGSVQIIDSLDNWVYLLTRQHFIVTKDGIPFGRTYSWRDLEKNPSHIHETLNAQLAHSLTDFENFTKHW